jgi:hypothetical protein
MHSHFTSLTHPNVTDSVSDCVLALAHLDLPALRLTCMCVTLDVTVIFYRPRNGSDVQRVLPFGVRHAHGRQDIQPLRSALIRNIGYHLNILASPVPDIDVEMHKLPAFLGATLPTRVTLSFKSKDSMPLDRF